MDKKAIAKKLVELRGNESQLDVAKSIGIAQSTYAMYESGKRVPTDSIKVKIAQHFNKTVQEIFFDSVLAKCEVT